MPKKKSSAWTRKEGQNKEGGLNEKGRKAYERDNPGSNLKPPVSKEQADKSPKAAARRKSFCARMQGMKDKLTSEETKKRPQQQDQQILEEVGLLIVGNLV